MVDKQIATRGRSRYWTAVFFGTVFQGVTLPTFSRSSAKIAVALGISFGWAFVNGSVALLALTAFTFAHLSYGPSITDAYWQIGIYPARIPQGCTARRSPGFAPRSSADIAADTRNPCNRLPLPRRPASRESHRHSWQRISLLSDFHM